MMIGDQGVSQMKSMHGCTKLMLAIGDKKSRNRSHDAPIIANETGHHNVYSQLGSSIMVHVGELGEQLVESKG